MTLVHSLMVKINVMNILIGNLLDMVKAMANMTIVIKQNIIFWFFVGVFTIDLVSIEFLGHADFD